MAAVSFDSLFTPLRQLDLQDRNRNIIAAQRLLDGDGAVLEEGRSAVGKTSGLTPVAPMAVTMLVTAQCNAYAGNGQNVRARTLFHATPIGIGWTYVSSACAAHRHTNPRNASFFSSSCFSTKPLRKNAEWRG